MVFLFQMLLVLVAATAEGIDATTAGTTPVSISLETNKDQDSKPGLPPFLGGPPEHQQVSCFSNAIHSRNDCDPSPTYLCRPNAPCSGKGLQPKVSKHSSIDQGYGRVV